MFKRVASLGRIGAARAADTPAMSTPSPREHQPGEAAVLVRRQEEEQRQAQQQQQLQTGTQQVSSAHTGHAANTQAEGSSSGAPTQQLSATVPDTHAGSPLDAQHSQSSLDRDRSECAGTYPSSGSDAVDEDSLHLLLQADDAEPISHDGLPDASADTAVVLNVGGMRYTTTLGTIRAVEGSYLDALFSGRWSHHLLPPAPRHHEEVFLDRDGEAFRHVLQYLRAVRTAGTPFFLPESPAERALLRSEADYYGLPGLAELCACYRGSGASNAHMALSRSSTIGGSGSSSVLASCMHSARRLWAAKEVEWAANAQLLGLKDLLLGHVLEAPLQAEQVDLIKALAQPEPGTCIEVSLQYYSFGDVRICLEACIRDMNSVHTIAEASTSLHAAATAACALAPDGSSAANGTGAIWPTSWRPSSPTHQQLTEKLAHAESAIATGNRCATPYYSFSIRESLTDFVLTKRMPGGAGCDGLVEERQPSSFKNELARYSALHKLLVQQPQPSYAGLLWLLQREGLAGVHVVTRHEQYFVGRNGFPGTKSVITLML